MFDQLFARPSVVARHANAPYAEERGRYLAHCAQRGDSHATLLFKARELLWVARKLSVYPDLQVTIEQVRGPISTSFSKAACLTANSGAENCLTSA